MKKKEIATRRKARVLALEALFQYEFRPEDIDDISKFDWKEEEVPAKSLEYAQILFSGTIRNIDEIDSIIKRFSKNWDFDRLNKLDKNILRLSIYQLLYEKKLNHKIIIDEAVEISKSFSTEKSYKFINGILDNIYNDLKKKNEITENDVDDINIKDKPKKEYSKVEKKKENSIVKNKEIKNFYKNTNDNSVIEKDD